MRTARTRVAGGVLACLLVAALVGCGTSSSKSTPTTTPTTTTQATRAAASLTSLRECFRRRGYSVTPDTPAALQTAPRRFEFVAVWNLLNPNRVVLSVAISRSVTGATRAAAWTRKLNAKLTKGKASAPVVRLGKIDVLWTAQPDSPDTRIIYYCVRGYASRQSR